MDFKFRDLFTILPIVVKLYKSPEIIGKDKLKIIKLYKYLKTEEKNFYDSKEILIEKYTQLDENGNRKKVMKEINGKLIECWDLDDEKFKNEIDDIMLSSIKINPVLINIDSICNTNLSAHEIDLLIEYKIITENKIQIIN